MLLHFSQAYSIHAIVSQLLADAVEEQGYGSANQGPDYCLTLQSSSWALLMISRIASS